MAWLAFLSLLGLYWAQLLASHGDQVQAAEQGTALRGDQAAHALAMQARSQLMKVEFFLEHLAEHWLDRDLVVFRDLVELGQESIFKGGLLELQVTDAEGMVLYSSQRQKTGSLGERLTDHDYFQKHARERIPFVISAPVRDEETGDWVLRFSQAYYLDGGFAGIVVASVSPRYLLDGVTTIYPERDNVVLMVLNNGRYLARSQDPETHLGRSVPADREFLVNPDLSQSHYRAVAAIDGVERLYAWHRVPGYPVVLSLGLSSEKALASTRRSIDHSLQQSLLATVIIVLAALWISGYAVVQHRQHRLTLQNQERMRILLRRFPAGVLMEDEVGHLYAANSALCRLLGLNLSPGRLRGMHHDEFIQLLGAPQRAGMERLAQMHEEPDGGRREEVEVAGGSTLELECIPMRHGQRHLGRAWFVQDISRRKQKERELSILASVDPLTGLLNRRSFMELLEGSIRDSRPELPGALLLLDVDHFKRVNDTYGHPAGDQVLRDVAEVIRGSLRKGDYTARMGGEEFSVLLPSATAHDAAQLAERIRMQLENSVTETAEHRISVTISIGIAPLYGHDSRQVEKLADKALYDAKAQGRNRICVASG